MPKRCPSCHPLLHCFAAAPQPSSDLTLAHFTALAKLIGALPVADLVTLIDGRGTVDGAFALAEQAARIVAAAFPPAAITADEVEFGLEALGFVCDAARLGATPFRLSPGQNPIRGGFDGARGHL